ncbi:hypothetical protein ACFOGI_10230 [Virgibacillus xinjiangensis]|uniref:Copper resistance protein D domain-containing protein n=1 Tax=Virgibacillus xinjiangensis TaxID=393090 RepID=A0ABV7CX02_9BACI
MREIVLILHIFLGIIWVGGILFIGWGVFPAVMKMSYQSQRQFLTSLMRWSHPLLTAAGMGVGITGILLGAILGPVKSWDFLWNTAYGNIWLAALLVGGFTLLWGIGIGYRETMLVLTDDYFWQEAEKGNGKPLFRQLFRIAVLESFEIAGFLVLIILMMKI